MATATLTRLPRLLASSRISDADGKSLPKLVCLSKKCWRLQTLLTLSLTLLLPLHLVPSSLRGLAHEGTGHRDVLRTHRMRSTFKKTIQRN